MSKTKKKKARTITKADVDMIRSSENFLIEKEKRYQRTVLGPQVENQTMLKETKKPAARKPVIKKKSTRK